MKRCPTPQGEPDFPGARYCRHYALSQRTALEDTCPPLGLMEVIRRTLREMVAYLVKRRPTPQGEPDFPGARYCRHYALSQRTALEDTCPPLGLMEVIRRTLREMVAYLVKRRPTPQGEPDFPGARYCRHYALSQRTALEDTCPPLGDIRRNGVPSCCVSQFSARAIYFHLHQRTALEDTCPPLGLLWTRGWTLRKRVA